MAAVTQGRKSFAPGGGGACAPRAHYESEQQLRQPQGSFPAKAERNGGKDWVKEWYILAPPTTLQPR